MSHRGFVISMVTSIVSPISVTLYHWSVAHSFLFKLMRASDQNERDDLGNHRYDKASKGLLLKVETFSMRYHVSVDMNQLFPIWYFLVW